jgi:hypothetical protein
MQNRAVRIDLIQAQHPLRELNVDQRRARGWDGFPCGNDAGERDLAGLVGEHMVELLIHAQSAPAGKRYSAATSSPTIQGTRV